MERIKFKKIDWQETGYRLRQLRLQNENLRKYVCFCLQDETLSNPCMSKNCDRCSGRAILNQEISRRELSQVLFASESTVNNWEDNRSNPPLEILLAYCDICGLKLEDILVFED